ncbi:13447_t:CDS:2, partial [Dentiscutata heterogama]
VDQDTWILSHFSMDIDIQYVVAESDDDDSDKENSKTPDLFDEHHLKQSVVESVASSSLESYLHQKDDNGYNKNELSLSQKRGPKNKRKNRLVPGEQVHLRDTILDDPYYNVQIVEVIDEGKVIVDVTFESSNMNQHMVQLADIIGYTDEQ